MCEVGIFCSKILQLSPSSLRSSFISTSMGVVSRYRICSTGMLIHVLLLSIHKVPPLGSSFAVLLPSQLSSFPTSFTPSLTPSLSPTHTHQDPQVPLLVVVWCTPGGGGPHVLTLLEHNYCMLDGQLEVCILKKEVEQTTSVYQNSHSTLPSLLGHRVEGHTCMGLSIRLEVLTLWTLVHFILLLNTTFHVQCVTLQHEELL